MKWRSILGFSNMRNEFSFHFSWIICIHFSFSEIAFLKLHFTIRLSLFRVWFKDPVTVSRFNVISEWNLQWRETGSSIRDSRKQNLCLIFNHWQHYLHDRTQSRRERETSIWSSVWLASLKALWDHTRQKVSTELEEPQIKFLIVKLWNSRSNDLLFLVSRNWWSRLMSRFTCRCALAFPHIGNESFMLLIIENN